MNGSVIAAKCFWLKSSRMVAIISTIWICYLFCEPSYAVHQNQPSEQGFVIWSKDKQNFLRLTGILQFDQDIFLDTRGLSINNGTSSTLIYDKNTVDRFWVRRARPIFSGELLNSAEYYFAPDFGQGQTRVFDAFVDLHYINWLQFAAGKQISLVSGLDTIKSPMSLFSMEPGYPSMMAPNRELGFILHGGFDKSFQPAAYQNGYRYYTSDWLNYQIAIVSETPDNSNPGLNPVSDTLSSADNSSVENKGYQIRVFHNPFQGSSISFLQGLGFGFAAELGDLSNEQVLPAMTSVGQNPVFIYNSNIVANGTRYRLHPQGYWFIGPFGVVFDWAETTQTIANQLIPAQESPFYSIRQSNTAGQMQLLYNVTGEHSNFNDPLIPNKPFHPIDEGTWGAFQLLARYTWLNMDPDVFNDKSISDGQTNYVFADPRISIQQAKTWSVGFNWFFNRYVRLSTEYDQTSFLGGCSTGAMSASNPGCLIAGSAAMASNSTVLNRPDEKVIMQRIQLIY